MKLEIKLEDLRKRAVKEDKDLLPEEKETYFCISGDQQDKVHVSSSMKPFIEQLLKCDDLELSRCYTDKDGNIEHLEGYIGTSHLRFKSKYNSEKNYISTVIRS